jgi:glycosyltransferase involved in cell wall biosynthesis
MRVGVEVREQLPQYGGAFTFQSEVLDALLESRSESRHEFCFLPFSAGVEASLRSAGVDCVPFQGRAIERAQQASRLRRALARGLGLPADDADESRRWQIAFTEGAARKAGVDLIWCLSHSNTSFDMPYIVVIWDLEHRVKPWFPEVSAGGVWAARERTFASDLPRATYVITGTEVGRREVERFYGVPGERVRVLGHPTPRFALEAGPQVGAGAARRHGLQAPYLLYPAQFWAHKNHVNLVLALRHLKERDALPLQLALVGSDKGNRAHVERVIQECELGGQVKMLGFLPQEELVGLYREALALSYVSFCGPENMPPLEAFALGCPVVASRVDGAQEQLGEAALLVDPKDPADIARGIKAVYGDERLREGLRTRGLVRAKRWTGREFVRGVFKLLDEFEPVRRAWGRD